VTVLSLKKRVQLELPARSWGGRRKGAGRPRTVGIVLHRKRPEFPGRYPLQVTMRIRADVGTLRTDEIFAAIQERGLLPAHDKFGMRIIEFSIQANHIHLVVEAEDKKALTRGMQGFTIRLARAINRVLGRRGSVFAERYHARILKTPTEVRHAVDYVRNNYRKHCERSGRWTHPWFIDPYSSMSGDALCYMIDYDHGIPVVAVPRTWLLYKVLARA
jgi:REP element-mobilizing transposase RayT